MIESDAHVRCALVSFSEAADNGLPPEFCMIHVLECLEVMLHRDQRFEPLIASTHTSGQKRSRSSSCSSKSQKNAKVGNIHTLVNITAYGSFSIKVTALDQIDLESMLQRCKKEDDINDEDQPIYISWEEECLKCRWCLLSKGCIEVRVINQHVKSSKTHMKKLKRSSGSSNVESQGSQQDIRSFFFN